MKIKVYNLIDQENKIVPQNIIFPFQTHSSNISEIKTGNANLQDCDGIFSSKDNGFLLGIKTADCAAICFQDDKYYGAIHAGWRGLVNGIVERMLDKFNNPEVFVAPLLNEFEIKRDDCYEQIKNKFGEKYFEVRITNNQEKIIFKFRDAIAGILPDITVFDGRITHQNKNFASWRRDKDSRRNFTVIG